MSDDLRQQFDQYIGDLFIKDDAIFQTIQENAEKNDLPVASIQRFEGYLLNWLVRFANVKKIVEIGTLAGYSGTWMATALPDGGKLYTIEKSTKHIQVAQANFELAGVADKVEIVQGEALDVLKKLEPKAPFDMIFIDLNKDDYLHYLDWALKHTHTGGLITAHNAFRKGGILDPQEDNDHIMRQFNQTLAEKTDALIVPMGDGMIVGVQR